VPSRFDDLLAARALTVGVVGLGYTGLPLALAFAQAGLPVVGHDTDERKIEALARGRSYLPDVSDAEVRAVAASLTATADPTSLAAADAHVVCVPTPVTPTGDPDLRFVDGALDALTPCLREHVLVVLQSTVPPGLTSTVARRLAQRTGLRAGCHFHIAAAPERIDPTNRNGWTLANTPKLVGGLTPECTRQAHALLERVCTTVVPVSSPEVAETAKVFENTFRLVNIALTYELADLCDELDVSVREVIDAAATKPFGFLAHRPGPGVGGECIPVDPLFLRGLAERVGARIPLIESAHDHVSRRPQRVVERLAQLLRDRGGDLSGSQVLVVGAAYKPEIGDVRNAPAVEIIRELRRREAKPSYTDPLVPELVVDGEQVQRVEWERASVTERDCLVLVTPHEAVMNRPLWYAAPLVLDTWQVLPAGDGVCHL
jgi:UDP-N-acetyl-D-glucosamine dehydrogenase